MKKYLPIVLLILIVILGFTVRFYKLGKVPAGIYNDEAGQGYAAYSIFKTGKDEFGKPLPIIFRSFTDFKTPVYIYSIVPLIPFFGLSTFTIRFPSAFFSLLTIPLIYFLILKLMPEKKLGQELALTAALLLSVSPWHIVFSRTDYECVVALFLFCLGIYTFYLSFKRPYLIVLSLIIFAVSIPAYHAERLLTPLTVAVLFYRFRKTLLSENYLKYLITGAVLGFLILLPTLSISTTPGFLARARGLNIFFHQKQLPAGYLEKYDESGANLINSSWFLTGEEFLSLYFAYYSPRNMFNLGDYVTRSSYPNMATFFVWEFPFYLIGLLFLIKRKELGELRFVTIFLLLIAPLPAAITRDPYTTIRSLPLLIPQIIAISLGIITTLYWVSNRIRRLGIAALCLLIIYSVLNLYSSGVVLNEFYRARDWNYGLEQVANFLGTTDPGIPVLVDSADENFMELAFFLKTDPQAFQKDNYEVSIQNYYSDMSRLSIHKLGRVIVKPLKWDEDLKKDQFIVADSIGISKDQIREHNLTIEKEILFPDQSVAYRILRTNPSAENSQKHP